MRQVVALLLQVGIATALDACSADCPLTVTRSAVREHADEESFVAAGGCDAQQGVRFDRVQAGVAPSALRDARAAPRFSRGMMHARATVPY